MRHYTIVDSAHGEFDSRTIGLCGGLRSRDEGRVASDATYVRVLRAVAVHIPRAAGASLAKTRRPSLTSQHAVYQDQAKRITAPNQMREKAEKKTASGRRIAAVFVEASGMSARVRKEA